MNKVILIGRIVAEPLVTQSATTDKKVARYRLAVDRPKSKDGEQTADFIGCVAFGKNAEFAQKYLHKGMKIAVEGSIRTGSYTNKDGDTVYTTDVVVQSHEFCEKKASGSDDAPASFGGYTPPPVAPVPVTPTASDFAVLDDDDSQLPF